MKDTLGTCTLPTCKELAERLHTSSLFYTKRDHRSLRMTWIGDKALLIYQPSQCTCFAATQLKFMPFTSCARTFGYCPAMQTVGSCSGMFPSDDL